MCSCSLWSPCSTNPTCSHGEMHLLPTTPHTSQLLSAWACQLTLRVEGGNRRNHYENLQRQGWRIQKEIPEQNRIDSHIRELPKCKLQFYNVLAGEICSSHWPPLEDGDNISPCFRVVFPRENGPNDVNHLKTGKCTVRVGGCCHQALQNTRVSLPALPSNSHITSELLHFSPNWSLCLHSLPIPIHSAPRSQNIFLNI